MDLELDKVIVVARPKLLAISEGSNQMVHHEKYERAKKLGYSCRSVQWSMDNLEMRNKSFFQQRQEPEVRCMMKVKKAMVKSSFLFTGKFDNSVGHATFLRSLNVTPRHRSTISHKEVKWIRPSPGWHKYNMDRGCPGEATYACTFRNYRGSFAQPLGV